MYLLYFAVAFHRVEIQALLDFCGYVIALISCLFVNYCVDITFLFLKAIDRFLCIVSNIEETAKTYLTVSCAHVTLIINLRGRLCIPLLLAPLDTLQELYDWNCKRPFHFQKLRSTFSSPRFIGEFFILYMFI